jgi:RNA-binding protein
LKRLIKEAKASHADVRIGKKGVTEEVVKEIKRRLDQHKVVKVKIGIEVEDRREFARLIAEKANAKLIEIRGYTFILAKKND